MGLLGDIYKVRERREFQQPIQPKPFVDPMPKMPEQKVEGDSVYEMVKRYGQPRDYTSEIRKAERAKKMATAMDILGMAGNLGTAIAGRRMFGKHPDATVQADARLQKLKDLQKAGQIDYSNRLMSAKMQDAANERARQAMADRNALQRLKLGLDTDYKRAMLGAKDADRAQRARQAAMQEEGRNRRAAAADKTRRAIAGSSNAIQRERNAISAAKGGVTGDKNFDYLTSSEWNTKIPKPMFNAAIGYAYKRMKDIARENPGKYEQIEDAKLQIGEGGDNTSKMAAIVRNRIADFPEVQRELNEKFGQYNQGAPINAKNKSASLFRPPYNGPLRPGVEPKKKDEKKKVSVNWKNNNKPSIKWVD